MAFSPGDHVLVEAESTDRPARRGVVEEVVRGTPVPGTESAGTTATRAPTRPPPAP